MDEKTLQSFRCLKTGSRLHCLDRSLIERINQAIEQRQIRSADGQTLQRNLAAGLTNDDHSIVYPIYDNIANLVADHAIELAQLSEHPELAIDQTKE